MKRIILALVLMLAATQVFGFGFSSGGGGKRYDLTSITGAGTYAAGTTYAKNDLVVYSGSSYVSLQAGNIGHTPDSSATYWVLFPTGPKGDTGNSGANGATWHTGFDTPAGAGVTGADGDLFFDTSVNAKIYKKTSGTWAEVNSIRGPAGADGVDGEDGEDGVGLSAGTDGTYGLLMNTNTSSYTDCVSGKYGFNYVGGNLYECKNGTNSAFTSGGGTWGSITGTLSNQTDLQDALDAITAGGINITTAVPSTPGAANLNDSTHILSVASSTGVTAFTGSFTAWDTTPTAFTFTDQTNVAVSTEITSAAITVAGINYPVAISVTGGTYDINASGTFTGTSGTVAVGDTVRARHTSSGSNSTAVNTTVTIGGVSDIFSSTTVAASIATPSYSWDLLDNAASTVLLAQNGGVNGALVGGNTSTMHTATGLDLASGAMIELAVPTTIFTGGSWTLQATFQKTDTPSYPAQFITQSGDLQFDNYLLTPGASIGMYYSSGGATVTADITAANFVDGNSHVIRYVYNGTLLKMFIGTTESNLTQYASVTATIASWGAFTRIGGGWNGIISDVKIWNSAVTP